MKKVFVIAAVILLALQSCSGKVKEYKVKVVAQHPHDVSSYTQGLFFHDGKLFESTGQWGESSFRTVDLKSGKAITKMDFPKKYFIEGSAMLDGKLYILTWTNKIAFVYDAVTLEYQKAYSYPKEGWGLTTDGKHLIASDGSATLYFLDGNFGLKKTLKVTKDGRSIKYLNELEYIDGKIWANVYMTDMILIINPESGNVEATIDCAGLLPKNRRTPDTDVLNGIAYNPADGKIYLTGKYWPLMFEIEMVKK